MVRGLHPSLNDYRTAGDGSAFQSPRTWGDAPLTPPCRPDSPWSEGSQDSDDDVIHVLGEDDPLPTYGVKGEISFYDIPRSRISDVWESGHGGSRGKGPTPVPWDESDLAFADIPVRPDYKMDRCFVIDDEGTLIADIRELTVRIRMVCDMYVAPWSTDLKEGWPGDAGASSDMIDEFIGW